MKTIILMIFLTSMITFAQDFNDISPGSTPQTDLRSIVSLDDGSFIVGGTDNRIYKLSNSGEVIASKLVVNDLYLNFHEIAIIDDSKFAAISYTGILILFDVDLNTTIVDIPDEILTDIDFVDASNGYVSTASGKLYHTSDGGENWSMNSQLFENSLIKSIEFYDKDFGVIAYEGIAVAVTRDAGQTWSMADDSNAVFVKIRDIDINDDEDIFICGTEGFCAKSTNLGMNWEILTDTSDFSFMAMTMEGDEINLATNQGIILHSEDGGTNWNELEINDEVLYDMVISNGNLFTVGNDGSIFEIDPGTTSSSRVNEATNRFIAVDHFSDNEANTHIYSLTGDGNIHQRSGEEWSNIEVNTSYKLYDISSSQDKLITVGADGVVGVSDDNGNSWQVIDLETDRDLFAVFHHGSLGIIAGAEGSLYYQSGNDAWMEADIEIPDEINIFDALVSSSDDLIAVGDSGHVYASYDMGNSWEDISGTDNKTFYKVYESNSGRIFIAAPGSVYELADKSIEMITSDFEGLAIGLYLDEGTDNLNIITNEGKAFSYDLTNSQIAQINSNLGDQFYDFSFGSDMLVFCGNNSLVYSVQFEPVSSVEISDYLSKIEVRPNPGNGDFHLHINSKGQDNVSLELIDNLGNPIYTIDDVKLSAGSNIIEINLIDMVSSGSYMLNIRSNDLNYNTKVVIIK